jgi:hypothetical protein
MDVDGSMVVAVEEKRIAILFKIFGIIRRIARSMALPQALPYC